MPQIWHKLRQSARRNWASSKDTTASKARDETPATAPPGEDAAEGPSQTGSPLPRIAPPARAHESVRRYLAIKAEAERDGVQLQEPAAVSDNDEEGRKKEKGKGKERVRFSDDGSGASSSRLSTGSRASGSTQSFSSRAAPEARGHESTTRLAQCAGSSESGDASDLLEDIREAEAEQEAERATRRSGTFLSKFRRLRNSSDSGSSSAASTNALGFEVTEYMRGMAEAVALSGLGALEMPREAGEGAAQTAQSENGSDRAKSGSLDTPAVPVESTSAQPANSESHDQAGDRPEDSETGREPGTEGEANQQGSDPAPEGQRNDQDSGFTPGDGQSQENGSGSGPGEDPAKEGSDSDSEDSEVEDWINGLQEDPEDVVPDDEAADLRTVEYVWQFPLATPCLSPWSRAGRLYLRLICGYLSLPWNTPPMHVQAILVRCESILLHLAMHIVGADRAKESDPFPVSRHEHLFSPRAQQRVEMELLRAFSSIQWTDPVLYNLTHALKQSMVATASPWIRERLHGFMQRRNAIKHCMLRRPFKQLGSGYPDDWWKMHFRECNSVREEKERTEALKYAQAAAISATAVFFSRYPHKKTPAAVQRQSFHVGNQFLKRAPRRTKSLLSRVVQPSDVVLPDEERSEIRWPNPWGMLRYTDTDMWEPPAAITFLEDP